MTNSRGCARINVGGDDVAELNVSTPSSPRISVDASSVYEAIQRHNMDESAHPFILDNFATKEYVNNLIGDIEQALSEV